MFSMLSTVVGIPDEPITVTATDTPPAATATAATEPPTSRAAATVGTPPPPTAADDDDDFSGGTPPGAAARAGDDDGGGDSGIGGILDYWYYAAISLGLFIAALVFVIYRQRKPIPGDDADVETNLVGTPGGSVFSLDSVDSDGATSFDVNTSENDDDDDDGKSTLTEATTTGDGETDVYDA